MASTFLPDANIHCGYKEGVPPSAGGQAINSVFLSATEQISRVVEMELIAA